MIDRSSIQGVKQILFLTKTLSNCTVLKFSVYIVRKYSKVYSLFQAKFLNGYSKPNGCCGSRSKVPITRTRLSASSRKEFIHYSPLENKVGKNATSYITLLKIVRLRSFEFSKLLPSPSNKLQVLFQ